MFTLLKSPGRYVSGFAFDPARRMPALLDDDSRVANDTAIVAAYLG
jgi:hypothetical protein